MSGEEEIPSETLVAKSPYELRVRDNKGVTEESLKEAIASGSVGFFHSFTTGSTVDGPGVRVVAWLTGCQFRCLYCHNPDTWHLINGIPVPLARAVQELGKYRHGLKVMSGGFTLSGGEPLMQDRFAVRMFSAAKDMGIHTALDTNGYLGERLSDDELKKIDLVLLDIKSWDPDAHRNLTGKDVQPVLEFARRLGAQKRPAWLRYVLVPGLTDDFVGIEKLAKFVADQGNFERVDVLPFHQLGQFKWKKLGINYSLDQTRPPSPEVVQKAVGFFRANGLKAV
jgi:pyruvate formate lyase activating enzyme